jgi:hypothetical protein
MPAAHMVQIRCETLRQSPHAAIEKLSIDGTLQISVDNLKEQLQIYRLVIDHSLQV